MTNEEDEAAATSYADLDRLEEVVVIVYSLQLAPACKVVFHLIGVGKPLIGLPLFAIEGLYGLKLLRHVRTLQGLSSFGSKPHTTLSNARLERRLKYLIAKYAMHAPFWQFTAWGRLLALVAVGEAVAGNTYLQAGLSLGVILVALALHVHCTVTRSHTPTPTRTALRQYCRWRPHSSRFAHLRSIQRSLIRPSVSSSKLESSWLSSRPPLCCRCGSPSSVGCGVGQHREALLDEEEAVVSPAGPLSINGAGPQAVLEPLRSECLHGLSLAAAPSAATASAPSQVPEAGVAVTPHVPETMAPTAALSFVRVARPRTLDGSS